jgi:hypothetical protein
MSLEDPGGAASAFTICASPGPWVVAGVEAVAEAGAATATVLLLVPESTTRMVPAGGEELAVLLLPLPPPGPTTMSCCCCDVGVAAGWAVCAGVVV